MQQKTDIPNYPAATPESVWAALQENERQRKENERFLTEKQAETDRQLKETDRQLKETIANFDRRMKKFEEMNGGLSNSQGMFAEEYFFNSFENGQKDFFGEKFDRITKNVLGVRCEDEYDILMINGKSIAIVEVKFRAREKDVDKVLKKANTFRINYPEYGNHRVYLGLAALTFDKGIEDGCKDNGIAIVKQVGEKVIITDKHLKVF
jgi:hypothetical protein